MLVYFQNSYWLLQAKDIDISNFSPVFFFRCTHPALRASMPNPLAVCPAKTVRTGRVILQQKPELPDRKATARATTRSRHVWPFLTAFVCGVKGHHCGGLCLGIVMAAIAVLVGVYCQQVDSQDCINCIRGRWSFTLECGNLRARNLSKASACIRFRRMDRR